MRIFKPNPRNTGSLFSFNFGPAKKGGDLKGELALYVSSVQQASWDAGTKRGSFGENAKNPEKTIRIKLNEFEIGGIINALKRRVEFKGYHSHEGRAGHVQFSFSPSLKENVFVGFIFSILRDGKDKFMIPITPGEGETLLSFLDFGLKTIFANRFKVQFSTPSQASQRQPERRQAPPKTEPEEGSEDDPFSAENQGEQDESQSQGDDTNDSEENPFG